MVVMQGVGGVGMISCGVAGLWEALGHWVVGSVGNDLG